MHAAAVGGNVACCRMLLQAGADLEARSNAGLSVWGTAASNEVRTVLAEPILVKQAALPPPPPEPKLLSRRHSIACADDAPGDVLVLGPASSIAGNGPGLGSTAKCASPRHRVRIPRDRSISTPFLVTHTAALRKEATDTLPGKTESENVRE